MGKKRAGPLALGIIFALASCGGEDSSGGGAPPVTVPVTPPAPPPPPPPPPPPAAASVEREITPTATNPGLTDNLSAHFTINPAPASARNRLFVMLPGTTAIPRFYRLIVRAGATRGYHSVGLTYPNDEAVGTICTGSTRPDCPGEVRREIITGEDRSPLVAISPANSITGRLTSLLTYLHTTYPSEGWGQYLFGGLPNWSAITVAGHSQGAGHAGYIAKLHVLDRAVMFSGPGDTGNGGGSPALWILQPNATPAARQYGFTHKADELVPYALVAFNWDQLGLGAFGAPFSVDNSAAPYGDRRQLTTDIAVAVNPLSPGTAPAHSATVVDALTPLTPSGEPLFLPVWNYMAFP